MGRGSRGSLAFTWPGAISRQTGGAASALPCTQPFCFQPSHHPMGELLAQEVGVDEP